MEAQQGGQPGGGGSGEQIVGNGRNIIFFKVETNVPGYMSSSFELLEFGAVVLDARGLAELGSFHTFIRPTDLPCIDRRTSNYNNITSATVANAPAFSIVADDIYRLLHGHIWAGHNISKFGICHLNEAFSRIGLQAPQASGVIDTYPLLRKTFGARAGNYKLATLADYCGSREDEHGSIAGIRRNIHVLRNCATVLFLESNYPDIFVSHMKVATTSTSMLESPTSLTKSYQQNMVSNSNYSKGGVDPQFRLSDQVGDTSSISRLPHAQSRRRLCFEMDANFELSNGTKPLKKSRLSLEPKDGKLDNMSKECNGGIFEKNEETRVAEVTDAKNATMPNKSLVAIVDKGAERDFPEPKEYMEASSSKANIDSRKNFEGVPFLSAKDVSLPSIEAAEEPSPYGRGILMLYYKRFPLHLLELKIRVRFTINASYAYDEKGKPRFSVLIEPSESACNVISKCEDVVKSMCMSAASGPQIEWLPALKKESGRCAAHLTIGTKWEKPFSTYTTKFFRSTSNGLKEICLGHVDAVAFRNVIPHGSVIDVGFGFYVFHVNDHIKGVRPLAKHITLT